jgi:hypothetical protein
MGHMALHTIEGPVFTKVTALQSLVLQYGGPYVGRTEDSY